MKSKGKTNAEIRQWYLKRIALIPELNKEWINQGLSASERAEKAWGFRHNARLQGLLMMRPDHDKDLRVRDTKIYGNPDGPTFEFLVEQLKKAGLEGDAIYEAIIDRSYRTNAELKKKLDL